jgi:hypothetical protein
MKISVQSVLDKYHAEQIAAYVSRRNKNYPRNLTTLRRICVRFRMRQCDVIRIIDSVDYLILSEFSYAPPKENATWGEAMVATWFPGINPDAPFGNRLVSVIDRLTHE